VAWYSCRCCLLWWAGCPRHARARRPRHRLTRRHLTRAERKNSHAPQVDGRLQTLLRTRAAATAGFRARSRLDFLRAASGARFFASFFAARTCAGLGTVAATGCPGLAAGVSALHRAIVTRSLAHSLRTGARLVRISGHQSGSRRQAGDDDETQDDAFGKGHRHSPQLRRFLAHWLWSLDVHVHDTQTAQSRQVL
jgi:hypothetical protein